MELQSQNGRMVGAGRVLVGAIQGLALYLLYLAVDGKQWPATDGLVFAPTLMVAVFVPLLVSMGLGSLRARTLAIWKASAIAVLAGLGVYDIYRGEISAWSSWQGIVAPEARIFPSSLLMTATVTGLFITHSLIAAADGEGRLIAPYPKCFAVAWKQALQLVLAAGFVGLFWLLLWLGAGLFALIKLEFFRKLIEHRWFAIPATTLAIAGALHVTDVRAAFVDGIRTLKLTLLSWLLPLASLIVGGFLVSLPFTGLQALWDTRHATALLLTAGAALVLLINAAYQEGEPGHQVARGFRLAGSLAAVALLPVTIIAAYALLLRIRQYGWTTDRVFVAAFLGVLAVHAVGYATAVVSRGPWLKRMERSNVLAAVVTIAVLLCLFSPVVDPVRIAVADQVARLADGRTPPDKFDYVYLRFDGGRYGRVALETLKARTGGPQDVAIAERADRALKMTNRYMGNAVAPPTTETLAANITVYPAGRSLPDGFVTTAWDKPAPFGGVPQCLTQAAAKCDAFFVDVDGDGSAEILIVAPTGYPQNALFKSDADGKWQKVGSFAGTLRCDPTIAALKAGAVKPVPPLWPDLEVAGKRFRFTPSLIDPSECGKPPGL